MVIFGAFNWASMGVRVVWAKFSIDISGLLSAGIIIFTSSFWSGVDNCAVAFDFRDWVAHYWAVSITIGRLIVSFSSRYTNVSFHASIKHLFSSTEFVWGFTSQLTMLFVTVFSLMVRFFCLASWWLGASIFWWFGADVFMLKITFNRTISWAKLVIVANWSFDACVVFFASIFIGSSWTLDLSFSTCGFTPNWALRSVISVYWAFTSFWDTDIVSDTVWPYTNWEVFFTALNLIFVAQIRNRAFLYAGPVAVFDTDFVSIIENFAATPFTYNLRIVVLDVLGIG